MNLYLIGYRGVGKTTVAPRVAQLLGRPWLDLDAEIEREQGASITQLFADKGEAWFRERESEALERAAALSTFVVATGGGVVMREGNQAILKKGVCVWLRGRLETILARLHAQGHRPRLSDLPLEEETAALLAQRDPVYALLALGVIEVDGKAPDAVADEAARAFSKAAGRTA